MCSSDPCSDWWAVAAVLRSEATAFTLLGFVVGGLSSARPNRWSRPAKQGEKVAAFVDHRRDRV